MVGDWVSDEGEWVVVPYFLPGVGDLFHLLLQIMKSVNLMKKYLVNLKIQDMLANDNYFEARGHLAN